MFVWQDEAVTNASVLEVCAIAKSYDGFQALKGLSFEAGPSDIIGLLGPNGAGKTTAIRILSTILRPSSGSFSLARIPHDHPARIRQRLGVLPESAGYPSGQTGEEFLRYHARLYGYAAEAGGHLATSLLAEVGLAERGQSRIGTYSRGMRQRLGVARALVNTPAVIFLDEPTLGLDPAGQRQMLTLVRDVAVQRGAAVIISTHFLDEVEELCARALILSHGEVVAEGTIDEIKRAAAPARLRVQVAPESARRAAEIVRPVPGIDEVTHDDAAGEVTGVFQDGLGDEARRVTTSAVLRALLAEDVRLASFDLERRRLSEAFLELTGETSQ